MNENTTLNALICRHARNLLLAQGYVTASDRLWQMDLLRRAAAGDLAQLFGPVALPEDRERRVLGLRQAAEAAAAARLAAAEEALARREKRS